MPENETLITKLERGRAEFAYECVDGLIKLKFEDKKFAFASKSIKMFKQNVIDSMKKKIEDGKITKEKIEEILNNPENYALKEKELTSKEEKEILKQYKSLLKDYRSHTRKIPQMILSNGLGQTLAFVYAKKEEGNAYDLIYKQLTDYLKSDSTARIRMPENQNELVEWVISLDSYHYRYVTEEVLAFLNWLKKFAEGMIVGEGGEE
ncbi:MAG: type III-B CRISPR module-associated protein Cmr5 [candidate division WOR-3 bacterium]